MARHTLTMTTLTATAALLLSACGGSGGGDDDIKGADTGPTSPTASASASASAPSGVKRPVIALPGFQLPFENWSSGDPVKQAVLNDAKEELRAGYAAIIANDPDSEAVAFYDSKGVVRQTKAWIKTYTDKNLTVIGKLPVFSPEVGVMASGKGASLTYCTDESHASTRNRATGKVAGNPPGTNPYVRYEISLAKSPQGVWQSTAVRSERGRCGR
ncbi:hypothetical protein [Streptomyces sp. NPDC086787]|uniref:hypothetical protein n=1 Tax=Streptomyces sp. NPDC086787 TaxID=3365759 RepID=UPI003800AC95